MSPVLRIALAAFSFVPLQRVLNTLGLAIALPSLVWQLARPDFEPIPTLFMYMGVLLIIMTPFIGGGAALRYASTPSVLHLRPHGRLRVLLGAALGITFIAALAAFPMFVLQWVQPAGQKLPVPGGTLFPVVWLSATLTWVVMFGITGGRRQLLPVIFILPFALPPTMKFIGTSSTGAMIFALVALAALLAFPVWYMRTNSVRRPGMSGETASWGSRPYAIDIDVGSTPSQAAVLRQYLVGNGSLVTPLLSGLVFVMFMALVTAMPLILGKPSRGLNPLLFVMLPALGMSAATMGHIVSRRSRLLWLRAGLDRAGLHVLARRHGLHSIAMAYVFPVIAMLGTAIVLQPELTSAHLAFVVASLASGLCLFHAGLSTTHDWNFRDIALMVVMVGLLILLAYTAARPGAPNSIAWAMAFTVGFAFLTLVLRAYALRNWLQLDWRVMRMLHNRR